MTTQTSSTLSVRNWLILLVLSLAFVGFTPSLLSAGEAPRVQFFGGYSRLQLDSKSFGFNSNTGLNGGTVSAAFNLNPYFGGVGEISVETGPNIRSRDWLLGPQFMYNKWKVLFFAHVLFGKAETRVSTSAVVKDNARATVFGGGVDVPIASRFSVRVVQVDYMTTHQFNADQHDIKFSTGVVFHLGKLSTRRKHRL
jgi:hypothetical protein